MRKLYLSIFTAYSLIGFAQVKKDSIAYLNSQQTVKLSSIELSRNLRVGIGVQKNFQSEIGYSRMKFTSGCTGFFSKTYYSSIEYVPKTENYKSIWGFKIGLEYNLSIIAVGVETKYLTNFDSRDLIFVPNIGIGFGIINAFYGNNFALNNNLFSSLNNHQFSLIINIPFAYKAMI